jgi:predicted nucleotidyltransferase
MAMVSDADILNLSDGIARHFEPDRIVLFGSYAYGEPTDDSDVDLLVIKPFRGRESDIALRILRCVDARFAVDLLVRTPADVERRYREYDPLIRQALDHGVTLHDKRRPRVAREGRKRLQLRAHPLPVAQTSGF